MADPKSLLASQWRNPSDVSSVLMVIGGDVVQTVLAQSTGSLFTPVCFSFGWVSYTFSALISILGEGKLLPAPDFPVKVFNLGPKSGGYMRENKNWVVGRILRDHESWIAERERWNRGIRIAVFDALDNNSSSTSFSYGWIHLCGLGVMIVQHVIAAAPWIRDGSWIVFLITAGGTVLAVTHGALPQWTAEKLPNQQHAKWTFALTQGNGSRDIMIVRGLGKSLNLEEMANSNSPRHGLLWENFSNQGRPKKNGTDLRSNSFRRRASSVSLVAGQAAEYYSLPLGFWITCISIAVQTALWLALLISVASVQEDTWFLLAVGFIGMFENGILAAISRAPETRNLPVRLRGTIKTRRVMDGLMDLELTLPGCGKPLVREFFPGDLHPEEDAWWNEGNRELYDQLRAEQADIRGPPGRPMNLGEDGDEQP